MNTPELPTNYTTPEPLGEGGHPDGMEPTQSRVTYPRRVELTQDAYLIEWYPEGSYMKMAPLQPQEARPRHATRRERRGPVLGFPRPAQRRLEVRLSKFRDEDLRRAIFITVTYPAVYPTLAESRHHLELFLLRLKRKYHHCCVVWRLEYQGRLVPHYHLLLLGVEYTDLDLEQLRRAWHTVTKSKDPHHLAIGVSLREPNYKEDRADAVRNYLIKRDRIIPPEHTGRFWGVVGDEKPYLSERRTRVLTDLEYVEIRRIVRKVKLAKARRDPKPRRRARRVVWLRRGGPWSRTVSCIARVPVERILSATRPAGHLPSARAPAISPVTGYRSHLPGAAMSLASPALPILSIGSYNDFLEGI